MVNGRGFNYGWVLDFCVRLMIHVSASKYAMLCIYSDTFASSYLPYLMKCSLSPFSKCYGFLLLV